MKGFCIDLFIKRIIKENLCVWKIRLSFLLVEVAHTKVAVMKDCKQLLKNTFL